MWRGGLSVVSELVVVRELAPAGVRSAPRILGPLRSPAGASTLATLPRKFTR
ncbi:hypothetical protein AK972_1345 [Pseudomonas yamanorum]|nr:hypothetical protein AK972_1345 [Pseudomonas yamanorum]